jgi:hypothetical protein
MKMPDLRYLAACLAFENVDAQEIRDVVDHLIDAGTYSDEFLPIIESTPPTLRDVVAPFRAYLEKSGNHIPDKDTAVWQIIQHHVSSIIAGAVKPFEGLRRLIADVYWDYDFHKLAKEYLGDSHGIEHLIGLYWGRDDMLERPTEISCSGKHGEEALLELDKEILNRCKEWMQNFANPEN